MTARSQTLRKRWLAVHLYLGLFLGLLLSIIGVTGSLLVFYIELDEWLNPALVISDTQNPRQPYQSLFETLQASEPNRQHAWRLEIPESPTRAITARYYKAQETSHHGFAPMMVAINPYTAELISKRFWGQYVMTWLFDLHYTLLLDATGKILMAIIGGLFTVSLISGIYLWWPPLHKLKAALVIKNTRNRQRLIYDIHKVSGVYPSVILLIITLTGIALEIPQYINPVIAYFSPLQNKLPALHSLATPTSKCITLDQAVSTAQQLFPEARLAWIETPDDDNGMIRINLGQAFEPSRRFPKTNVWIDQYSGEIVRVSNPSQQTAGTTLISWLHPLHNGEVFGMTGRLLVFIAGLACPLLFVTGVWRWLHKRQAQQHKAVR